MCLAPSWGLSLMPIRALLVGLRGCRSESLGQLANGLAGCAIGRSGRRAGGMGRRLSHVVPEGRHADVMSGLVHEAPPVGSTLVGSPVR